MTDERWQRLAHMDEKTIADDDLLVPIGMPDLDAYLVISRADRLQSAATLYAKLLKCVAERNVASKRKDAVNSKMPKKVVSDIQERWLTSIEEWIAARDAFMRLRLTKAEVELLGHEHHRNIGIEDSARLVERWKDVSAEGLRTLAGNIRKLQR